MREARSCGLTQSVLGLCKERKMREKMEQIREEVCDVTSEEVSKRKMGFSTAEVGTGIKRSCKWEKPI